MPRRTGKRTRRGFILRAAVGAVAGLMLAALPGPGGAQSPVDADFQRYCREKFNNSQYRHRAEPWGVEHYCMQGSTPQNIDYGEACRLTTGAAEFRREGLRVLCTGAVPKDAAAAGSGPPDFQQYCKDKFPNSEYEKRAESWGVVHYCHRPGATGGFTLQSIDLADACERQFGTRQFRKSGGSVTCQGGGNVARNNRPDRPEPGPGPEPRPPLPFPKPQAFPKPAPGPAPEQDEQQTPARADQGGNLKLACQALGGQWHSGTIPMVEQILAQLRGATAQRTGGCVNAAGWVESCRSGVRTEQAVAAYFQTLLIWQCHVALVRQADQHSLEDIRTAREEGCIIQETLSDLQDRINKEVATMQVAPHEKLLETANIDDLCAKAEIRFVHKDGTAISDDEPLPHMQPVMVEITFDRKMKNETRKVSVLADEKVLDILAYKQGDAIYRSKPFMLLDRPSGTP